MQSLNSWVKPEGTYIDGRRWYVNGSFVRRKQLRHMLAETGELSYSAVDERVRLYNMDLYTALTKPKINDIRSRRSKERHHVHCGFSPASKVNMMPWR